MMFFLEGVGARLGHVIRCVEGISPYIYDFRTMLLFFKCFYLIYPFKMNTELLLADKPFCFNLHTLDDVCLRITIFSVISSLVSLCMRTILDV